MAVEVQLGSIHASLGTALYVVDTEVEKLRAAYGSIADTSDQAEATEVADLLDTLSTEIMAQQERLKDKCKKHDPEYIPEWN